jgi:CRP-like cAMP-binding protein
MLFDQGDEGDAMYLIDQGGITICAVDEHGREQRLRTFGPGSVVGDFAVVDGQPRSARARAEGPLAALVLSRQMFKTFIQSRPGVILAVLQVLAEKARFTTEAVETSIRAASSIAQGNYGDVVRLTAEQPPLSAAEPVADVVSTDYSTAAFSAVTRTFSRLAAMLQGGEMAPGKGG